jgi:proline iminopeptidase
MLARIRGTEIFFDVDGAALAPDRSRPGALTHRPTVFLLHGGPGGDHSSFKAHTAPLRDAAQLVYIDHRGSGRSARAPGNDPATYTLDNNVEDIEALRDHLGLERITVLGSSYGGMVAQGYAIRHPGRVANLILSVTAPSSRFIADGQRIVRERGTPEQVRACERLWNGTFETQEQVREYFRTMGPLYAQRFDEKAFDATWGQTIFNPAQLNAGFGPEGFLRTFDFTDRLGSIQCPTLVLAGAHDWICPPDHSRLIAERIPRAHLKVFANSAHLIATDEPDAYLAALRGFLTYAEA